MFARDYKTWAKEALRGHWFPAICVSLVGSLLGGGIDMVSGVLNTGATGGTQTASFGMMDLAANDAWPMMVTVTVASILLAFVIGGAISFGIAHHFTNLTAHRPAKFADLFSRFGIWHKGIWMNIVVAFFVMLWSLLGMLPVMAVMTWLMVTNALEYGAMIVVCCLLVAASFPGWIAAYRYSMIPYLLAEFPDLTVMDAMRESKRLMRGKKWRLFCLQLSFFGWALAAMVFTAGIGYLWLNPYMQASNAAFYLDATGRKGLRDEEPEA